MGIIPFENGEILKYLKLKITFRLLNKNIEIKVEIATPIIPYSS